MTKLEYNRKSLADKYHLIEIFNCPIEIILSAANLSSKNVTVENARSRSRQNTEGINMTLKIGDVKVLPTILKYEVDFMVTKEQFIDLSVFWDKQGCYAIFHDSDTLRFKATDLDEKVRYKVLDNFGWTLELAIPGSASSGWGQITSPSSTLID